MTFCSLTKWKKTKKNNLGHYEMPLPFKERPTLPDNTQLAMTRLNHLKRRLSKDQTFHRYYTDFMNEIIDRGHAEEAMEDGDKGETSSSWRIPLEEARKAACGL